MRHLVRLTLGLLLVSMNTALGAQQRPPNCSVPEHRQFDFWLGTWDVFNPAGDQVGENTITLRLNGCVIHEQWQSIRGPHRGNSFNIYDRSTGSWHQTWVDNSGLLLQLDGALRDGSMVLEGRTTLPDGTVQLERVTWWREESGSVRQLWEQSTDDGQTWTVAFDGRYVRR